MQHDAWGKLTSQWKASTFERGPFGFAAGLYDEHTELSRFGAREYDSPGGRWLSKDEARLGGRCIWSTE